MAKKTATFKTGNKSIGYVYLLSDKPSPSYKTYTSMKKAERILKKQGYIIK